MQIGSKSHAHRRVPEARLEDFRDELQDLAKNKPTWRVEDRLQLDFDAHHPQGLVKAGDHYFLSTVQKQTWRRRGRGYIIKFDSEGKELKRVELGDWRRNHPGGIDFDGENLWVSVAEYRPESSTQVFKVDKDTLEPELAFTVNDHIGAVTRDTESGNIVGTNWDSEKTMEWTAQGELLEQRVNTNRSVNYQDWKYAGKDMILASGPKGRKGGLDLVDNENGEVLAKVPIPNRSPQNKPITQNPMTFRYTDDGLKLFLVPDDGHSELLVLAPQGDSEL